MTHRIVKVVFRAVSVLAIVSTAASAAYAQAARGPASAGPRDHGFLSVGFGSQTRTPGFTDVETVPVYAEQATFETRDAGKGGTAFGLGGGVRVWRGLSVGAAWTSTSHRHDVDATARLPHPFRFNDVRVVEGRRDDLKREES